jgi:hypothetical protein
MKIGFFCVFTLNLIVSALGARFIELELEKQKDEFLKNDIYVCPLLLGELQSKNHFYLDINNNFSLISRD